MGDHGSLRRGGAHRQARQKGSVSLPDRCPPQGPVRHPPGQIPHRTKNPQNFEEKRFVFTPFLIIPL